MSAGCGEPEQSGKRPLRAVCLAGSASKAVASLIAGADEVIAADGGARHAMKAGRLPDLVIGDLDSLSEAEVDDLVSRGVPMRPVPAQKDETDGELAVREALARGSSEIVLVGAVGDRVDHVLSNLGLLALANREGAVAWASDGETEAHALSASGARSTLGISARVGWTFSVVPFPSETAVVSINGARWALERTLLSARSSRGLSNVVTAGEASVVVHEGDVVVFLARL